MKINEDNYIKELKNKNQKALGFIYSKYSGLVYKVVYDILNGTATKEDIEECVSDIFIEVWNNAVKYNENITSFKNWIVAVSKYKAIDYFRKLRRKYETVELEEDVIISSENIESKIIQDNNIKTVYQIIDNMSDVDKKIFIKRYFLDESIINISSHLKLPRSVIDNRLSRGRRIIKNKWNEIMGR